MSKNTRHANNCRHEVMSELATFSYRKRTNLRRLLCMMVFFDVVIIIIVNCDMNISLKGISVAKVCFLSLTAKLLGEKYRSREKSIDVW